MLLCVLHNVAKIKPGSYIEAVRQNILACGDNCSRSCFVGAYQGASVGLAGLPREWIFKTDKGGETVKLAERLISLSNF